MTMSAQVCRWFLRCENPATVTLPHPILGAVPACQSCADKVARLTPPPKPRLMTATDEARFAAHGPPGDVS